MSPTDREAGQEAVEAILDAYYRNIGTPAPAPGIERLALVAVEAAYDGLRRVWADDVRDKAVLHAVASVIEQTEEADPLPASVRARMAIEAALLVLGFSSREGE